MKTAGLLLSFILSTSGYSQDDFFAQVNSLLNNSTNSFEQFKGTPKHTDPQDHEYVDSVFLSSLDLWGTKKNEITYSKQGCRYDALIADSLNEIKAIGTTDQFKNRLYFLLNKGFALKELKRVEWNPGRYGWNFENGNVIVSLTVFCKNKKNECFVYLGISRSNQY